MSDSPRKFPLSELFAAPLDEIADGFLLLARHRELRPSELVAIARGAQALRRLPLRSEDIFVDLSLTKAQSSTRGTLSVEVTAEFVTILRIESFDSGVGWDHEYHHVLDVEIGGFDRRCDDEDHEIEHDLWAFAIEWKQWAESEASTLTISDETEDEEFWESPPSDRWMGMERDGD